MKIDTYSWIKKSAFRQFVCRELNLFYGNDHLPRNTPRGFHVETTWKRSFPRRLNVESTWCVYSGSLIFYRCDISLEFSCKVNVIVVQCNSVAIFRESLEYPFHNFLLQ